MTDAAGGAVTRALERVSRIAVWIAGGMMLGTVGLVSAEVALRKVLNMSFGGADELSGYAYAIASSWAFAFALLSRDHIRIDVVYVVFPARVRAALDMIALASLGAFAVTLAIYAWQALSFSLEMGATANTPLATPLWIPQALWLLGFILFLVVLAVQFARSARAVARGDLEMLRSIAGTKTVRDEVREELDRQA